MGITFNIKRKFTVNGVEYGSPEEMPTEIRAIYEKATQSGATLSSSGYWVGGVKTARTTKITINGRTYDSLEAMPEEDRKLYEQAMGTVRAEAPPAPAGINPAATAPAHTPLLREKPRDDRRPVNKKGCGFFLFILGAAGLLAWAAFRIG
jgi:hypothetical protein